MTTTALVSWTSPHVPCPVPGRGQSCDSGLGPEESGLGGQADAQAWRHRLLSSFSVSPPSSWGGHGPHLGLPGPGLGAAALGAAAATGDQQQQQHGAWRVGERQRAQNCEVGREGTPPSSQEAPWRCGLCPQPGTLGRNTRGPPPCGASSASRSSGPSIPGAGCWVPLVPAPPSPSLEACPPRDICFPSSAWETPSHSASPPASAVVSPTPPALRPAPWSRLPVPGRVEENPRARLTCEEEDDREGHDLHGLGLWQPL